ncbi:MAG: PadR family transcriptional regulator [Candidatus Gastranaerophilales bacterium]|nr:PadR family transcriptional regulator [Candidatus Gastranaerophilales bacterium]
MIEILILYIIYNREKTIYSIRKEIIDRFGNFTKPSLGTIHPALKRLRAKNAVSVSDKMSEGGKKSSYYIITQDGKKLFRELFKHDCSTNPCLFYAQIQARFATIGLLAKEERNEFLDGMITVIDRYNLLNENKLLDEYIGFDFYQKELVKKTLAEAQTLKNYALMLKEHNER